MTLNERSLVDLKKSGRIVLRNCLDCGWSARLEWCELMLNNLFAEFSLSDLMASGWISCELCNSLHLMLTSEPGSWGNEHLLLMRSPHPQGKLRTRKNVTLQASRDSIFIPYGTDGKGSDRRAPYIDLKKQPESICLIPEIMSSVSASNEFGGDCSFQRLVETVNADPDVATLACSWESDFHEYQYLTYGYIDVLHVPFELNTYESVRAWAESLQDALCNTALVNTQYLLAIKYGVYELKPVFVLDIEAIAAAPTERESYLLWEELLRSLGRVLVSGSSCSRSGLYAAAVDPQ